MLAAEFFAGMGLMRAGLKRCGVKTVFANDIDKTKAALYRENWGDSELVVGDIRRISGEDVPNVNLATASFPCVDLSLAGNRAGLNGATRSSVIFEFFRILAENAKPSTVDNTYRKRPWVSERHGGEDFKTVIDRLRRLDYQVAHGCVNASAFVPQSRDRVFIVGSREAMPFLWPASPPPRDDLRLSTLAKASNEKEWWPPDRLGAFCRLCRQRKQSA